MGRGQVFQPSELLTRCPFYGVLWLRSVWVSLSPGLGAFLQVVTVGRFIVPRCFSFSMFVQWFCPLTIAL